MAVVSQRYEVVPVDRLRPDPRNARRGDVAKIRKLIEAHGFWGAIIARSDGTIAIGEHRWRAAREAGNETVPVLFTDADDATILAMLAGDNKASDVAGHDEEMLLDLLRSAHSAGVETLYDQTDVDELLRRTGRAEAEAGAFLDDIADNGQPQAMPSLGDWVQLSFVVAPEDRELVWKRLDAVMADEGCSTRAEALLALCRQ